MPAVSSAQIAAASAYVSTKPSTAPVYVSGVGYIYPSQASTAPSSLVAPSGSYAPLIVQPQPAPAVTGISASTAPVYVSGVGYIYPSQVSAAPSITTPATFASGIGANLLLTQPQASGLTQAQQAAMAASGGYSAAGRGTNRLSSVGAGGGLTVPIGQAFPRELATLTPQGTVATGAAAMGAPVTTPSRQPSQVVSPYSGRSMASDAFRPAISQATVQHLDYLDRLQATDPGRAAEVARFQSATIGRAQPEAALATNVFFTESAVNNGQLPRTASEQVWDVIAMRMGLGMNGAQLLRERGYVPIGGGLWYLGVLGGGEGVNLGSVSNRNLGGDGGGGGGGGRFLGDASAGLFNWRISA